MRILLAADIALLSHLPLASPRRRRFRASGQFEALHRHRRPDRQSMPRMNAHNHRIASLTKIYTATRPWRCPHGHPEHH